MDGMVTAGKIGGLFGNRGELTLVLYESFPRDPNMEEPVFVTIDGHAVPLFFEKFARRGIRGATVVFADIDTAARAAEFTGREFSVRLGRGRGTDSDGAGTHDDELRFEDMVGWEAEMGEGRKGRITAFFDNELNPLFEIAVAGGGGSDSGSGGEVELIPAQEDFIAAVDEHRRRVVFDLPEGLLGLNKQI